MPSLLTTYDNPFNPVTNFREWLNYDTVKGYNTCGLIARLAPMTIDSLPVSYTDAMREDAIDRIIKLLPSVYTKVEAPPRTDSEV